MAVSDIRTYTRDILNTNSTVLPDAEFLRYLNFSYGLRILDILRLQVDRNASQTEVTTTFYSTDGLVAGDVGFNGEYPFPTDLLKPVRFEVSYDAETWLPATVYDLYENLASEHLEDSIQASFSEAEPFIRFDRNSYVVRPLKTTTGNVTAGLHIWYEKRQTAFTADSDAPDMESNLHNILAYDVATTFATKYPEKVSELQLNRIQSEHARVTNIFNEFYKNRLRVPMRVEATYPSYK